MSSNLKYRSLVAGLAAPILLTACDRAGPPEPAPKADAPQTSIIREGFEDPDTAAIALAPLEARISFADGGEELNESAIADLETILNSPQVAEGGAIVLRAHSDSAGPGDTNMEMSELRGNLVRDWLTGQGIAAERIEVIAFGEQNPLRPNAKPDGTPNEAGRAANRRVNITVTLPTSEDQARPTVAEQIVGASTGEDASESDPER